MFEGLEVTDEDFSELEAVMAKPPVTNQWNLVRKKIAQRNFETSRHDDDDDETKTTTRTATTTTTR